MVWRGSSSPRDRIFACLVYMIPLLEALPYGAYLFSQLPILGTLILIPLAPFMMVNGVISSFPFGRLILFFVLLLAVVRNPRFRHFLRFNTMQALLLSIALFLIEIVRGLLGISLVFLESSNSLMGLAISNLLFFVFFGASVYSIVQCALGRYPEFPIVSDAAYQQVPY